MVRQNFASTREIFILVILSDDYILFFSSNNAANVFASIIIHCIIITFR